MRRRRTAPPTAAPRRSAPLPALLLAALAALVSLLTGPAAQTTTSAPTTTGSPAPTGASPGRAAAAAAGTTQRTGPTHRSSRSDRSRTNVAQAAVTGQRDERQTSPLLAVVPGTPPDTMPPVPPVTPLLRDNAAVPPPAVRSLAVSPGRSPPSDPRRA